MISARSVILVSVGPPSTRPLHSLARIRAAGFMMAARIAGAGHGASLRVQVNLAEAGRLRAPRLLPRLLRGVHRMDHSTARNLDTQPLHLPRATVSCFTRRASFRGDRLLPFSSAHEDAMLGCFRRVAEQRSPPPTFVTDAAIAGHIFRLNLAQPKSSFLASMTVFCAGFGRPGGEALALCREGLSYPRSAARMRTEGSASPTGRLRPSGHGSVGIPAFGLP